MFTMTPRALTVVRTVTGHPRLTPHSGLRIAGDTTPLQVRAVDGPRPGDEVVERDGARVFVGGQAARRLRGRLLDIVRERSGRVHFVVRSR